MLSTEKTDKKEIFSSKERDEVIQKIFFKKEIDSAFLYKGNGGEMYDKIIHSSEYEKYQKEMQLLQQNKKALHHYITKNITEIGCGNGEKIIILLKDHPHINDIEYIASDYSANVLELAENNISAQLPKLKMGNHQIMRPGNKLFTNSLDENTYLRLGCTIGNFSKKEAIEQLKSMNNSGTLKGNFILFSYFTLPQNKQQREETIQLYQNDDGKNFVFNGLENLGLDIHKFDYIVEYSDEKNCIYIGVQLNDDYILQGENGKEIQLKKGEKFFIHQSKRFSEQEIKAMLKQAGAKLEKHISSDGISLIVAKKDPKYYNKTMKIMGLTGLILMGVLGGGIGYNISQDKQEKLLNEQKSIRLKEFFDKEWKDKDVIQGFHFNFDHKTNTPEKMNTLNTSTKNAYYYLCQIYGKPKKEFEGILLANLQEELRRNDNLNSVNFDIDRSGELYAEFLKNIYIPNHFESLTNMGIDLEPYKGLAAYTGSLENTCNLEGEIELGYDRYGSGGTSGQKIVYAEKISNNLKSTLPWEYVINSGAYKTDTIGARLSESGLHAKFLGSYFLPTHESIVDMIQITIKKDGILMDIILFSPKTDSELGIKTYKKNKGYAKAFLKLLGT